MASRATDRRVKVEGTNEEGRKRERGEKRSSISGEKHRLQVEEEQSRPDRKQVADKQIAWRSGPRCSRGASAKTLFTELNMKPKKTFSHNVAEHKDFNVSLFI